MLFLSLLLKMNFQQIPPPCRPPNQFKPSSCKISSYPIFQTVWCICSHSTSSQKAFPYVRGIPAPWRSLVSLWAAGGCAASHNLLGLFPPRLQPLPMSPVQGEGDEQQKPLQSIWQYWAQGQSSAPSLKSHVHLLPSRTVLETRSRN